MFKLKLADAIRWPVTIHVPADGGTTQPIKVTGVFRPVTQARFNELVAQRDGDILKEVVLGWDGIADADGAALPFSAENLVTLVEIPYARMGFIQAWMEIQGGGAAKN